MKKKIILVLLVALLVIGVVVEMSINNDTVVSVAINPTLPN